MELLLMGISVAIAFLGWWLAYLLYCKRPELPQKIADSLGGFYQTVVHKYYIDELYAVLFVKPLIDGSTRILWQDVDRKIIDAAVNDAGDGAKHVSDEVRHMQSGNIRSYAGWMSAGAGVVIAFMIWMWTKAR
jgi:NADH-quinone oxidoreductase subunit L